MACVDLQGGSFGKPGKGDALTHSCHVSPNWKNGGEGKYGRLVSLSRGMSK